MDLTLNLNKKYHYVGVHIGDMIHIHVQYSANSVCLAQLRNNYHKTKEDQRYHHFMPEAIVAIVLKLQELGLVNANPMVSLQGVKLHGDDPDKLINYYTALGMEQTTKRSFAPHVVAMHNHFDVLRSKAAPYLLNRITSVTVNEIEPE